MISTFMPKLNGIKRPYEELETIPSTSNSTSNNSEMIIENGIAISQLNGIHNGSNGNGNVNHDPSTTPKPSRINGIHKNKESPKKDVKAILRNSINHKQEAATGPPSTKKTKLEVANGTSPTNGRINGTSPTTASNVSHSNGPTTTTSTSKSLSSSSMAIVT
jgi:hypothetical protein